MFEDIGKNIRAITTEDLRDYLSRYYTEKEVSKITIDNIRRNLSSFFTWLEDENYIYKSPFRRIHKIKTTISVKDIYSDEDLENKRINVEIDRILNAEILIGHRKFSKLS